MAFGFKEKWRDLHTPNQKAALGDSSNVLRGSVIRMQFERPGATFAAVSEYPVFPWAEGLANAIANRDYGCPHLAVPCG